MYPSDNYAILNEIKSTKDFWIKNANAFPNLKKLALFLFNIPRTLFFTVWFC